MKFLGFLLAIAVLITVVGGVGYGLVSGYGALSVQWSRLDDEWRAVLIVTASMILFAALFVTYVLARTIRRESHLSTGRVGAYNEFVIWYSMLIRNEQQLPKASTLVPTKNSVMLWGSNRVVRQMNMLYGLLITEGAEFEAVIEKARHIFLEIKRELGHRNPSIDRSII